MATKNIKPKTRSIFDKTVKPKKIENKIKKYKPSIELKKFIENEIDSQKEIEANPPTTLKEAIKRGMLPTNQNLMYGDQTLIPRNLTEANIRMKELEKFITEANKEKSEIGKQIEKINKKFNTDNKSKIENDNNKDKGKNKE